MKLTLGKKLGLGFGVILALMVLSAVLTYSKASAIKETQDRYHRPYACPPSRPRQDLQRDLNQTQSKGRQAILAGTEPARWEEAKKGVRRSLGRHWKRCCPVGRIGAQMDLQANRDRLADIKKHLPATPGDPRGCDGSCSRRRARCCHEGG